MLIELRIQGYAVIDDQSLRLGSGLNALTGETGAGKSIVVGAISLLLGERASSEVIRAGEERAMVEAVFDIAAVPSVVERLHQLGFAEEDRLLLLKREVQRTGRNRAWVNGSPATVAVVWELGSALVDLHGQHEHQTLLRREKQREVLDTFAGAGDLVTAVRETHQRVRSLAEDLDHREARQRELEARADFLRFQLGEIDDAQLRAGEDAELTEEASRLEHSGELSQSANQLHELLYAGDDALTDRLAEARSRLHGLVRYDSDLGETADNLESVYHQLTELGRQLGEYAASIEHDPGRLDEIRSRQDGLFRLKRKYGPDLEGVIRTGQRLRAELEELEGGEVEVETLRDELGKARMELAQQAKRLTERRETAGETLAGEVQGMLPDLGIAGGRFEIFLERLPEPGAFGSERVEFKVALNEGFDPRPLSKVASGGELSRLMLALKTSLAEADPVPTLVFDEIDAGIGGEVATRVASKLTQVAALHQVFVVTHLPQLASRARAHLRVEKHVSNGMPATVVRELTGEERVAEIARMLGGDSGSERSRAHARELLEVGG